MVAHHTGVPRDLLAYRSDLDPRVKRVVSKAMARDPEKRYASAREVVEAWSGVVGIPVETRDTSELPTTGRASRVAREEEAPEAPRDTAAAARDRRPAREERREPRRGGLLGWLRRNRD